MHTSSILKNKITFLFALFGLWVLVLVLQKPMFLLFYGGGLSQLLPVVWHGLPLDLSMAGYLSALPGLILLAGSVPLGIRASAIVGRFSKILMQCWFAISALAVSLAFIANCALYDYWRFPLDSTPVFFLTSSPKDALASIPWFWAVGGVIAVVLVALLIFWLLQRLSYFFELAAYKPTRLWGVAVMLPVVGLLFLPIRGGVTVASMNTGTAYFSENQLLNHAAVNPLFSFMESILHQNDFAAQYRFMDEEEALRLSGALLQPTDIPGDTTHTSVLTTSRPDIYLIVMESFSDTLTKVDGVTPRLNRLKQEGIYFSNFYANSFRTDRGLVSILLGYPSPATVSLMKYPKITASLPSLTAYLGKTGWTTSYYYGGDADFTNMRSFLVNQGFRHVTEDVDFPIADRMSKWGVPDHLLFARVKADLDRDTSSGPHFRVVQTSSSHEPFDVPYNRFRDKILNAFAYTDSCVSDFVKYLKSSGRWQHALVILVPDHLGAWPQGADNFATWRYHVPMIWTGGAVKAPAKIDTYASQQDIAATLLGQLGIVRHKLRFSKDIFCNRAAHFAFFMMHDGFGLIDDENELIYDHNLGKTIVDHGLRPGKNLRPGQAYVQRIFDDIASRQ